MPVLVLPPHSSLEAASHGFSVHTDCLAEHLLSVNLHRQITEADSTWNIIFLLTYYFHLSHSSSFVSTRSCPFLGTYLHLLLDHFFCFFFKNNKASSIEMQTFLYDLFFSRLIIAKWWLFLFQLVWLMFKFS